MIRQTLFAGAALAALTLAAQAADLPSRKEAPLYVPPPPVFTWSGVYIGGQIGYEFGRDFAFIPGGAGPGVGYSPTGVIGGAHIGYNWQMAQFVFGLEGDVNGAAYRGTGVGLAGTTLSQRIPVDGSVRGRLGYAFDRVLLYATGGAAFAAIQDTYLTAPGAFASQSRSRVGWTVGGGLEYAVTNNWSIRAEYRYTDYGRYTDTPFGVPVINHPTDHRVMAGFSYKFDMFAPAPIVAKY
jgi:outer membrane immunogenic protein